jgi:hypothetical protein
METTFMKKAALLISILGFAPLLWAHHNAPDEMQDFIEDQLIEVDSPHLLSSDDDPSLLETDVATMDDLDYVIVASGLDDTDVTAALEDILMQLDNENELCDDAFTIDMEVDGTYTLTVYVDFCAE